MSEERFIARQPIFDTTLGIVAYELLFRSDLDNYCKAVSLAQASSSVISDSVLLFDLARLTDGKGAFINIAREGLLNDHARILPCELATIELLETIEPDDDVIDACRQLKKAGYRIALDDFTDSPAMRPLIALADVIKVDLLATPKARLAPLVRRLRRPGLEFLAEKVETREEFDHATRVGFTLFQGYFFAKPVILSGKSVPGFKAAYLDLLKEINKHPFDINRVEDILKRDVSLSYKFLRYVNSAALGLRGRVTSIRETLLLLGQRNVRALASVWALAGLGKDQPEALLLVSVTRARFCEGLATAIGQPRWQSEAFLLGMLSLIDAIMGQPMATVLDDLPISDDVRLALVEQTGPLHPMMACVLAYEQGDWNAVSTWASQQRVDEAVISQLYLDAIPTDLQQVVHDASH
jgi:EAL and modified HD-GYP domain-containing signal transduction protein